MQHIRLVLAEGGDLLRAGVLALLETAPGRGTTLRGTFPTDVKQQRRSAQIAER